MTWCRSDLESKRPGVEATPEEAGTHRDAREAVWGVIGILTGLL
ncbi:MAG TPA: hypothetical protein VME20_04420 [Acidimicrobiales bacterium]|nr:hypothetical protein [Acidimicrobiales bacterium]